MSPGSGAGAGSGGPGGGFGADNSNSGPHGKINEVKNITRSPSAVGQSGTVFAAGESRGAPSVTSPAAVPYANVLPSYNKAAEKALSQEKVPPAYRKRVKDYFSSLEP